MIYNSLYGPGNCYDQTVMCQNYSLDTGNAVCHIADAFCAATVENIFDIETNRDEYDIRYISPNPFPPSYYEDYLNTEEVLEAIGAFVNFTSSSNVVGLAFDNTGDDDRESGTVEAMRAILDAGVSVTMYFGDADYNCNWMGGQVVAEHVNATDFENAGFTNITTSDSVVHGQVKQAGKFAFVRIYDSGHLVPFFQPLLALEMFTRVINDLDIASGTSTINASYLTKGTQYSTFREGNSTVQLEVVGENDVVVYDHETNLPVFLNGSSANTGPGSNSSSALRVRSTSGYEEKMKKREAARAKQRKRASRPGWRPRKNKRGAMPVGGMRMPHY
jgi:hypothetical protein